MKCQNCQKDNEENVLYCSSCGVKIEETVAKRQQKSKEDYLKGIKYASIAGFVASGITALFSFFVQSVFFLDALFVLFLSVGIFKYKSRFSSVILLIYFIISKLFQVVNFKEYSVAKLIPFVFISIAFISFFSIGITGTFQYHKENKIFINKRNLIYKVLITFAYGIVTFILFFLINVMLFRYFPNMTDGMGTLILFIPVEIIIFSSLIGVLPISNRFPVVEKK